MFTQNSRISYHKYLLSVVEKSETLLSASRYFSRMLKTHIEGTTVDVVFVSANIDCVGANCAIVMLRHS